MALAINTLFAASLLYYPSAAEIMEGAFQYVERAILDKQKPRFERLDDDQRGERRRESTRKTGRRQIHMEPDQTRPRPRAVRNIGWIVAERCIDGLAVQLL